MTDLRRKCREAGVSIQVVKNTLAIKALRKLELEELEPHFKGPTALAVAREDPTSPARILIDFRKEHEKPEVKLGFVDGRVLAPEEVKAIANLPSRDQLISQVMQLAQAPASNFVAALKDVMSQVVRTVEAVRDGMEKGTIQSIAAPTAEKPAEAEEASEDSAEAPAAEEAPAEAEAEAESSEGETPEEEKSE